MKIMLMSVLYIAGPFVILFCYNKFPFVQKIGTVLMAYTWGILMSLLNWLPSTDAEQHSIAGLQDTLMSIAVPLAIPLLLFSSDFRLWKKSLNKTASALLGGLIAVVAAVTLGFFLFRNESLPELWKAGGMMTGLYTGGTLNLVAIGESLNADATLFTLITTFDMALSFFFLLFIVGGGFRLFRRILPFSDGNPETVVPDKEQPYLFEDYSGMFHRKTLAKNSLGILLSLAFLAVAAGLSQALTDKLNELIVILTISTLAIAASFFKPIRELPKTFETGMIFILLFSIVIASQFDVSKLHAEHLNLVYFIGFVLIVSTGLHLLLARLFKVPGDLFTVVHVSLLYSPPFVPPVAGAMHNKKVLLSGISTGLVGWAIGTYLGLAVAQGLLLIP